MRVRAPLDLHLQSETYNEKAIQYFPGEGVGLSKEQNDVATAWAAFQVNNVPPATKLDYYHVHTNLWKRFDSI